MLNREKLIFGNYKYEGQPNTFRVHALPIMTPCARATVSEGDGERAERCDYQSGAVSVLTKETNTDNAIFAESTLTNVSDKPIKLMHVSSFTYSGINVKGNAPWWDKNRFMVHYAFSTWQGEAQWRCQSVYELGLYPASNHAYHNQIEFRSIGSLATAYRHPVLILEDTELKRSYFFELETGCNWEMSICVVGYGEGASLCVEGSCAAQNNDGWYKLLGANESYKVKNAIVGEVEGGFEEAVRALTDIRRKIQVNVYEEKPAAFNDYMGGLWAMPTHEKLIPMIDKAAEVGSEVFCIDAGWYKCNNNDWNALGDWGWDDEKFGDYGFLGIINYIKSKGMKPGVWLEIEALAKSCLRYSERPDLAVTRNGEVVGSARCFLDFRKADARSFIESVFDRLYSVGIRFIKNDYNQSIGIGADGDDSFSEAMADDSKALTEFLDYIQKKYPDLVIESCASGGIRSDMSVLRINYLQSTSDQEYYYMNPSIIVGSAACFLPEKAGIWSYPYALPYEHRTMLGRDYFADKMGDFEDGEETAFNMINSMFGIMYLSGHIECADEKNTALIKESVDLYKATREEFRYAYPAFVTKPFGIVDKLFAAYGLETEKSMLLAVWKIDAEGSEASFDLSKYTKEGSSVKLMYPQSLGADFSFDNGILTVRGFDKKYMARLFYIEK